MKIRPNAAWGYPATPFIVASILFCIGDVTVTVLLFDFVSFYLLLPLLAGFVFFAIFTFRAFTVSLTLTATGIEYKRSKRLDSMAFADMKEVVYTERAYVGNNVKPCLYFVGDDGKVKYSFFADSWGMKDIKAFYDAVPDSVVQKRIADRGY